MSFYSSKHSSSKWAVNICTCNCINRKCIMEFHFVYSNTDSFYLRFLKVCVLLYLNYHITGECRFPSFAWNKRLFTRGWIVFSSFKSSTTQWCVTRRDTLYVKYTLVQWYEFYVLNVKSIYDNIHFVNCYWFDVWKFTRNSEAFVSEFLVTFQTMFHENKPPQYYMCLWEV